MKKLVQLKDKNNNNYDPINQNYENRLSKLEGKILYEHSEGATGEIELNDSTANYEYIEIYYSAAGNHNSTKIYNPNGKWVLLFTVWTNGNTAGNLKVALVLVNNNKITKGAYTAINYNNADFTATEENGIGITRVVGYK